jgi:hypothetical protein
MAASQVAPFCQVPLDEEIMRIGYGHIGIVSAVTVLSKVIKKEREFSEKRQLGCLAP